MSNEVEVEVVLSGAEEAKKGLGEIGETAGKFADKFNTENDKLGEGLSSLTDSVGGAIDSVKDLGGALQSGSTSMLGLLGPIGAVVAAGFALYETYQMISGAAAEAEQSQEAMAAAVGDLQSKLEALAEKGVIPTANELLEFSTATIESQYAKERLQQAMEKGVTPAMKKYQKSLELVRQTQDKLREGTGLTKNEIKGLATDLIAFNKQLEKNRQSLSKAVSQYRKEQERELAGIKAAAELEEGFEERSAEATLARIKENRTKLEGLMIAQMQTESNEDQAKGLEVLLKKEFDIYALKLDAVKEDKKALKDLDDKLKKQLAALDAESIIKKRANKEAAQIAKAARDKEKQAAAKAAQDKARIALASEMKKQAQLKALRALELKELEQNGVSALKLAKARLSDNLTAAKNNNILKKIAHKQYQLEINAINKAADEQRQASEQARIEQEKEQRLQASQLAYDSLEFDLNLRKDGLSKELSLLELKYNRERELNAKTQDEITELNRREAIERTNITNQSIEAQIAKVGEFADMYGAGLAEAAYNSLLFGESFQEATGEILIALGRQAAVQALMETAKGTAALFLPAGQAIAAGHFKAAGLFLGASAAAGLAGKALGGGGGASGGGATSPTGAPSISQSPQREEAEAAPMVFNINFGGAVIYDTQRAAEQALADRITTLQNVNRRGAPRRRA